MQMDIHCLLYCLRVAFFQRGENLMVLTQEHLRRGDMVQAHVAHAVDGRLDVFNGIPRELALGDLRQFLVKLVVQLEKVV